MPKPNLETRSSHKIRIITNVLTTALKLWLRAQVSQVSQLEVEIRASDRQILSGCIPWVSIFASHAVYQGLHLTQVQLVAENIRINIGSVLKGQPLRLLEIVPVVGELILEESDLNASVSSALLSTALQDVLVKLLPEHCSKTNDIELSKITLENSHLILSATIEENSKPIPVNIRAGLELVSYHELQLAHVQINSTSGAFTGSNNNYKLNLDLGSDVDIQELTLIPGKLVCRGRINVNP